MNKLTSYVNLAIVGALLLVVMDTQPKDKFVGVVEKVMPAVVEIQVSGVIEKDNQLWVASVLGSGVFISDKGHILTCAHLFNDFIEIKGINVISPNDDTVAGRVVNVGKRVDLAVIKVDFYKKTPKVKLADPRKLRVGQEVFAIGSPLGMSFSVTSGIISALYRDLDDSYNVTQSDTAINQGNSGGPLFNLKGELVGINSFMIPPVNAPIFTGLGFSVQCGEALKFLIDTRKIDKSLKL